MEEPLNQDFIEKLRAAGLLRLDHRALGHVRRLLEAVREEAAEPDQDADWVRARFGILEAFNDTFWMLSEEVESPIEHLLGAHLIFISDGYNDVRPDFFPGASPDSELRHLLPLPAAVQKVSPGLPLQALPPRRLSAPRCRV
jgi:hypothetical protein